MVTTLNVILLQKSRKLLNKACTRGVQLHENTTDVYSSRLNDEIYGLQVPKTLTLYRQ